MLAAGSGSLTGSRRMVSIEPLLREVKMTRLRCDDWATELGRPEDLSRLWWLERGCDGVCDGRAALEGWTSSCTAGPSGGSGAGLSSRVL